MRYKLFVSDFDGTLVRQDGTVSERNRRAISRYMAAGGIFTICTGRMPASILPRLKDLGITQGLVAAFQGAAVVDIATGKVLQLNALKTADAVRILQFMEGENWHIHAYTAEQLYCNRNDEFLKLYEKVCGVKGYVPDMPLSELVARQNMRIVKALIAVEPADRDNAEKILKAQFGEEFYVTSSADYLVEVVPKGQNKGEALKKIAEHFHIPIEETAAIGDQRNDLPLVMGAGGKFAVENAVSALKEIATVVPSCEEDGVAYAIEKYAMGDCHE